MITIGKSALTALCTRVRPRAKSQPGSPWLTLALWIAIMLLAPLQSVLAHPYSKGPPTMPPPDSGSCPQCPPGSTTCSTCTGSGNGSACPMDGTQNSVTPPMSTGNPIFLGFGTSYELATDLTLSAAGINWVMTHSYQSLGDGSYYSLGNKVLNSSADTFFYSSDEGLTLLVNGVSSRAFTLSGSTYVAPTDSYLVLTDDTVHAEFILTDKTNNLRWVFYDFTSTNGVLQGFL